MGKAKSPDYEGAAIAQGEANRGVVRDQTFANRPDQFTPWGSTSWNPYQTVDPATGEATTAWEQVQTLDPKLQSILDKQIAVQEGRTDMAGLLTGRLGGEFGAPMDWRGLNPMGTIPTNQFTIPEENQRNLDYSGISGVGDPERMRERAENAVWDKGAGRLADQFGSQREQLEIKLRNQGIGPEDAAWQSQMNNLGQTETDAYGQLQSQAVTQGMGEANQMFGQDMSRRGLYTGERDRAAQFFNQSGQQAFDQSYGSNQANFGQAMQSSQYANQIRQQQLTEAMQKRGFSLNEINALLSGQQVQTPQMPNFQGASAAEAAPIYQGAVDQGNFSQAQTQQAIDAATGLGAMGVGMSDRRLKSNIKKIGTKNGYNWYSYNIFGLESEGVMADEVPAEFTVDVGGYTAVDYDKLGV